MLYIIIIGDIDMSNLFSPKFYLNLKRCKIHNPFKIFGDIQETYFPRYQTSAATSHRRGEKRMQFWVKLVK